MYVTVELRAPDEGSWIALTQVSDDGDIMPMGYIEQSEFEQATRAIGNLHTKFMNALSA